MSLIEVARLTDPQVRRLAEYAQRWSRLRGSTETCDRAAAEAGVVKAYAAAGLAPPREFVWAGGPVELAHLWACTRAMAGGNVRSLVVDQVCRKAEIAVDRAVGLAVRVKLAGEPGLSRVPAFCAGIDDAALQDCERIRPPRLRLANLLTPHWRARISFAVSAFGFHSAPSLAALEYFHDVCGLHQQAHALAGLWQVAKNAGWMLPHKDVCWLAERPEVLHQDARGRLHAAEGPAVVYRDQWSAYAWKGVLVPSWIIERPELITVRAIGAMHDPQIRHCMIDILTPEKFIAGGGAYRVAKDETGTLWRQRWRWEAWAAVEVVNGTAEANGTHRHYFLQVPANMRTAREAVAWTYGLPEQRYRPNVRT